MSKLILLGGPTGVGKTTVMRLIENKLDYSAILDADDVWRVAQTISTDKNRVVALDNVISVMRGYFKAGCKVGILSWVFARSEMYEPIIRGLEDMVESISQIYLIASEEVLEKRLLEREDLDKFEYSKTRLDLIKSLPFPKIDTSNIPPCLVADKIVEHIYRLDTAE